MDQVLDKIRERIGQLRAELGQLETAEAVIVRMDLNGKRVHKNTERKTVFVDLPDKSRDFSSLSVKEAARKVLADSSTPRHYKEVFSEATARGYSSGHKGGGAAQSFAIIMRRNRDLFEAVGEGKFRLKENKEVVV